MMTAPSRRDTPASGPPSTAAAAPLAGWTLISLRPAGTHEGLRRAARARDARVLACSPLRLEPGPVSDEDLAAALAAPRVIFSSPAAVRFAAGRATLRPAPASRWLAVGEGTAKALRRAGIGSVATPRRMDSEGVLALPELAGVGGVRIGLVTAPGGRGLLAATLADRGAQVLRADVYRRQPVAIEPRRLAAVAALPPDRCALLLSSGEAFAAFWSQLPPPGRERLQDAAVTVASSQRLLEQARQAGLSRQVLAASARPAALLDALTSYASANTFG